MDALSEKPNCDGGLMNAPRMNTKRREIGRHIGGVLRYAREAQRLNLNDAPVESIERVLGHVIDCAGALVWNPGRGRDA